MPTMRSCSFCGMYRQKADGSSAVHRYGLSRQVRVGPRQLDGRRPNKYLHGFGGLDICDPCLERHAGPNRRPELRGKTGPKPKSEDEDE